MGKNERVKSRKQIERIFREGKSFALYPFRVYYAPLSTVQTSAVLSRPVVYLQAGFGASSRHFKKAVDRNRIKRLIREAYRLQRTILFEHLKEREGRLAVFFIYTGKELPEYGLVRDKIELALRKLMKETGTSSRKEQGS